ncbi:MAG: N-acetylglucosamine kinase [Alphaproteobacteria bacterium]|nr:N-acetylglucosamine kinase [Alphaproteobacteria bacterium]
MTEVFFGIDGGGSGTRAAYAPRDGAIRGRGAAESSNLTSYETLAAERIVAAASEAARAAGADNGDLARIFSASHAVLGLAGSNIDAAATARVSARLPFGSLRIVSDSETALAGARGGGAGVGALASAATGTVYSALGGGESCGLGGGGWMGGVRPPGAGAVFGAGGGALGRPGGGARPTPMTTAILEEFGGDAPRLALFAASATPRDFAGYAPRVFAGARDGDETAAAIIARALSALEATLEALCPERSPRLFLLGGLSGLYAPLLSSRWRGCLSEPLGDALEGAILLARGERGGG